MTNAPNGGAEGHGADIRTASPADMSGVRSLLRRYADEVGFDPCLEGVDQEIADLPGGYAPPAGRLLVADADGVLAGCIALRRVNSDLAECRRLYVVPARRGEGIGRALIETLIAHARQAGYTRVGLQTLPAMETARTLYESCGFQQRPPDPKTGIVVMSLRLEAGQGEGGT